MKPQHYVTTRIQATVFVDPVDRGYIATTANGDAFGWTVECAVARAASRCLNVAPDRIQVTHDFGNVWVGSIKTAPKRATLGVAAFVVILVTMAIASVYAWFVGGAQ